MLSKIETGQLFPTLPTLLRIALVFGVGLENFFVEIPDRPAKAVIRKSDRLRLPSQPDQQQPAYFFESLNFPVTGRRIEAYLATFPENADASSMHNHAGEELIYVFTGKLAVKFDDETTVLDDGDALYFDSSAPHNYRCEGSSTCVAIIVTVPD